MLEGIVPEQLRSMGNSSSRSSSTWARNSLHQHRDLGVRHRSSRDHLSPVLGEVHLDHVVLLERSRRAGGFLQRRAYRLQRGGSEPPDRKQSLTTRVMASSRMSCHGRSCFDFAPLRQLLELAEKTAHLRGDGRSKDFDAYHIRGTPRPQSVHPPLDALAARPSPPYQLSAAPSSTLRDRGGWGSTLFKERMCAPPPPCRLIALSRPNPRRGAGLMGWSAGRASYGDRRASGCVQPAPSGSEGRRPAGVDRGEGITGNSGSRLWYRARSRCCSPS